MKAIQQNWIGSAAGLAMDPDQHYGLQCVDVIDHYAETIFGTGWRECVGGVNGAKDLLNTVPRNYWDVIRNDPNNASLLPVPGDVLVWGGNAGNPYGHTAVAVRVDGGGATVIQQNSNGLANQAAHSMYMPWYGAGTGMITGWLRPRPERVRGEAALGSGVKLLTVTASPAVVRTSPRVEAGNVAPAYPHGIAKGAQVAAVGYVSGQDPYPNDGRTDDAWIKTKSGYFIWANGLGNSLAGLPRL